MNITLQEVGKRLYERRKQLRMTQEELAERVGRKWAGTVHKILLGNCKQVLYNVPTC